MSMFPVSASANIAQLAAEEEKKAAEPLFGPNSLNIPSAGGVQFDQQMRDEEYQRRIEEKRFIQEEAFLDQRGGSRQTLRTYANRDALEANRERIRQEGFARGQQPQDATQAAPQRGTMVNVGGETGELNTTDAFIGGQRRRLLTPDRNMAFNSTQWQSILENPSLDDNQAAIDILGDTTDAISQLQTPEARQFTQLYDQLEADQKQIQQDATLTENERKAAIKQINERRAGMIAEIPSLGDLGVQLESQSMREAQQADTAARKQAEENLRDYEGAFRAAQTIADKQEAQGIPVTPEQFRAILGSEIARRNAAADYIAGEVDDTPSETAPTVETPTQYELSNPTGGLVYGANADGTAFARVEGAGPSGPKIPTRALGNTLYPAPTTADQVKLLHKGTQYFAPGSNTVSVATTGPDAPNEAALKKQAEDEKNRVEFEQKEYAKIFADQTGRYENFVNNTLPEKLAEMQATYADYAGLDDGPFPLTAEDVMAGRMFEVLGQDIGEFEKQVADLAAPPADPNSEAGRQERERELNLALKAREEAIEFTRKRNIQNQQRAAPYQNSIAAFEPAIADGRDVVVYTNDAGRKIEYEAYTITQPGSAFYGRSLPVIRNSDELMQLSPELYPNFAYYSPAAGRVLASVAAKGSVRGSYTPEEATTIMGQIVELYPADFFGGKDDHFETVFDAFTDYMGYSRNNSANR